MLLNEFFTRKLNEGGNLAIGQDQADTINLKVHDRKFMVPLLNKLLVAINNSYAAANKHPLWSPETLQSRKFLSGSSLHFFDTNIPDDKFVQVKPKVGDIDTQVNKEMEQSLAQFLDSHKGKPLGPATLIGYERGNEQFSSLWSFAEPPIKVQIDLEFVEFEKDAPTDFAAFSHSSSWDDMSEGVKGVFHKFIIQSLTKLTSSDFIIRKVHKKTGKVTDKPVHDSMLSFAVSSKEGGGLRAKYEPVLDATGNQEMVNGVPVFQELPPAGYERNIGKMFQAILGHRVNEKQLQAALPKTWSFTGLLELVNAICTPEEKQNIAQSMIEKCYAKGAQGLYKNDPQRDAEEKDAALNVMFKKLGIQAPPELAQTRQEYMSSYRRVSSEGINEADESAPVKAQLRKGMPHLHDLKAPDFLDLLDEIHDGNGRFKLENIPLNVKVDGFGGRFGKDKSGKPFMGTSRTEPRYEASFVKYHQQKGTTDPEILGRAQMFDDLFNEMMNAIKLVDGKLGPDFLVNKQVTCEVLFLPFAQQTDEGKLKFVGIHYDKLPEGVQLALVPFHAVEADSGEPVEDPNFVDELLKVGQQGSVMFINNRLVQKEGLDVTEIINVLDNIDELKQIVSDTAGKRDRASLQLKKEVEEKLQPIKDKLEQAIIKDPNIIGKDMLGKDYEGIVINSRLGPIKITSQEQRDVISAKLDAKKNARTERPRDNQNKTAVVAIGSFVGHKGHQELWNYTQKEAQAVGGDPYLFIGNAEGKDDPIPVGDKVKTWHQLYPQFASNISAVTHEGGSIMQKIKHELINPLPGKPPRYDNIIIMVGEDRKDLPMGKALMKAVNKFPGYEHVKVDLKVTPRGQGVSGTALRNSLKNGNPNEQYTFWNDTFNGGKFGAKQLPPEWIKHLMDVTKKGMGITTPSVTAPIKKQEQPAMAKPQPPVQQQPEQEPIAESIQREIMIKRAEIAWLKESQNASQMAPPSGPAWDKNGGHHRLETVGANTYPKSQKEKEQRSPLRTFSELANMLKVTPNYLNGLAQHITGFPKPVEGVKNSHKEKYYRTHEFKRWVIDNSVLEKVKSTKSKNKLKGELPLIKTPDPKKSTYSSGQAGNFFSKTLENLDSQARQMYIRILAKKMGWDVSHLELASTDELKDLYNEYVKGNPGSISETKRMSAAVKLQRAWEREQAKSTASRKRGEEVMAQAKKDTEKKQQGVAEGSEIKIPTEDGITMQDIRLMAGEGPLTKKTVLQAIAVIRKQRREQGVAEVSDKTRNSYVDKATSDYGHANFAARASKSHPGLEKYSQEQERRAEKRRAGLNRALSDKRTGRDVDEDQRLDKSCWTGYKKQGTKMKGGTRVNNCVKVGEGWEAEIASAINKLLESKK